MTGRTAGARLQSVPGPRRPRRTCGTDTRRSACPALTPRGRGREDTYHEDGSFREIPKKTGDASPDQGIDSPSGSVIQPKTYRGRITPCSSPASASVWLLSAGWAVISASTAQDAPAQPNAAVANHRAVIDCYCVTCHNQRTKASGLALDGVDLARPGRTARSGRTWFASSARVRCRRRGCRARTKRPTTRSRRFSRRNWIARGQRRRIQAGR